MRALNRRWRGRTTTTDVLSFPAGATEGPDGCLHVGDIVVSVEQAARQARSEGRPLSRELRVLLLHGWMHLLGYDHERDDGTMMRLQRRLERSLIGRSVSAP
jgi:rRNA maturation RNase YbeY